MTLQRDPALARIWLAVSSHLELLKLHFTNADIDKFISKADHDEHCISKFLLDT